VFQITAGVRMHLEHDIKVNILGMREGQSLAWPGFVLSFPIFIAKKTISHKLFVVKVM
jgi:hypothetical protein